MGKIRNNAKEQEISIRIGKNLKELRRANAITQAELGEFLGITLQQIQKYENGKNRLPSSKLFLIAEFLGVDVNEFFE